MAETARTPLITDEDLDCLDTLRPESGGFVLNASDLNVLAPRLRARWVAEALEALADEPAWALGTMMSARVRDLAAEYRHGLR